MKILVVDDDNMMLHMIKHVLGDEGFAITACRSVDEAVAALEQEKYALVITDIVMPEKDGIKLVQYVRKSQPAIPVLAMTAGIENATQDYVNLAEMYADEVLAKPIAKQDLLQAISRLTAKAA